MLFAQVDRELDLGGDPEADRSNRANDRRSTGQSRTLLHNISANTAFPYALRRCRADLRVRSRAVLRCTKFGRRFTRG
jgi:hypothetical protein